MLKRTSWATLTLLLPLLGLTWACSSAPPGTTPPPNPSEKAFPLRTPPRKPSPSPGG